MKRLLFLILALLMFLSFSSDRVRAFDESILLVEKNHTFEIKFSSPIDLTQKLESYIKVLDDRGVKHDVVIVSKSGTSVRIRMKGKPDPSKIYRVSVAQGLLGQKGEKLKKTVARGFLPKYDYMLSLCENLYTKSEGKESGKIKADFYKIGSRKTFRKNLDRIKNLHSTSSLTRERELELVGQLQQAALDFQSKLWSSKEGDIKWEDNSTAVKNIFSFSYSYTKEDFENYLTGFRAVLLRDEEEALSTLIHKEDYTNLDILKAKVYYMDRFDFSDYLSSPNLNTGRYSVRIYPIYKNKSMEESFPSAAKTLVDLSRFPKAEFYFKPSLNLLVFEKIEAEDAEIAFNVYTEKKSQSISISQDTLDDKSKSSYFGENFSAPEKLVYTLSPADVGQLFSGNAFTGEIHVEVVNKVGDPKRTSPVSTLPISFITDKFPRITNLAGLDIDTSKKFSKAEIAAKKVKNTEDFEIKAQNSNDGFVMLYPIVANAKDALEIMHNIRFKNPSVLDFGGNKKTVLGCDFYNSFDASFATAFAGIRPKYSSQVKDGVAKFRAYKSADDIGKKFIAILQGKDGLYYPLDLAYIEMVDGEAKKFAVGYGDPLTDDFTAVMNGTVTDRELQGKRVKVKFDDGKSASVFLLDESKKNAYQTSADKPAFLKTEANVIWSKKNAQGTVNVGDDSIWQKLGKYMLVSMDKEDNIHEVEFEITDGTAPEADDIVFYIKEYTKEGNEKYDKFLVTYKNLTEEATLFFVPNSFQIGESFKDKAVFSTMLSPSKKFVEGEVSVPAGRTSPWFNSPGDYMAYLVDANGNVKELDSPNKLNPNTNYPKADDLDIRGQGNPPVLNLEGGVYKIPELTYNHSGGIYGETKVFKYENLDPTDAPLMFAPISWYNVKTAPLTGIPAAELDTTKKLRVYMINTDGKILGIVDFTLNS